MSTKNRTLACVLVGACAFASISAGDATPPAKAPPEVEAWAMLFQMMGRLHDAVAQRELSAIHLEDPVASAAVSTLLQQGAGEVGLTKVALIAFVRDISALHTAADAAEESKCVELMKKAEAEFEHLQASVAPELLQAAHRYAERYTCPMHPKVIGKKNDTCSKCGMPLDQLVVLTPSDANLGNAAEHVVRATIETDGPLTPGAKAFAVLHLRRGNGEPVTLDQLIETHSKKIHLLIVDESLTDYHHEHPRLTETPGDYVFEFTPRRPGPYLAWADLRPTPLGLQEYDQTTIAGNGKPEPLTDRETRLSADVDGFRFELSLEKPAIRVGVPTPAKLRITQDDGLEFTQLEPVMAAFAHVVGFNEDHETVLHLHPLGRPVLDENSRGGPELQLIIYATKPGFTRLFAQVQIGGRQIFAPFGIQVLP